MYSSIIYFLREDEIADRPDGDIFIALLAAKDFHVLYRVCHSKACLCPFVDATESATLKLVSVRLWIYQAALSVTAI